MENWIPGDIFYLIINLFTDVEAQIDLARRGRQLRVSHPSLFVSSVVGTATAELASTVTSGNVEPE